MVNLGKELSSVMEVVKEAGLEIKKIYDSKNLKIEYKNDDSPVTIADMKSNKILIEGLKSVSDLPIISEEIEFDFDSDYESYWIIDPLDGTKAFIENDNDEFSIMVAKIEKGEAVLGIVYLPISDVFYIAERGLGAYKIEKDEINKLICIKKELKDFIMVISKHHFTENDKMNSKRLEISKFVPMSSIGIKLGEIANRTGDIYLNLDGLNQWDLAAGYCILKEAGGDVFDKEGKEFIFSSNIRRFTNGVIAISNTEEKEKIIKIINSS